MKLRIKSIDRKKAGYVLLLIFVMIGVMTLLFASVLTWSSSHAVLTRRNNLFNISENAAESCTENVLATMMSDFTYSYLKSSGNYTTLIPPTNGWPVYFQFSDTNGSTANSSSVIINNASVTNLGGTYSGLYGLVQQCQITSTATPQGQSDVLSATASQTVQFAQIPLFQFGIFYNLDLEINPTTVMGIGGSIWCNGNIYNSPSGILVYFEPVYATGKVFNNRDHPNDSTANGTGPVIYSQAYVTNTGPTINEPTLTMPVGTSSTNSSSSVNAILQYPPSAYAPPNYSAAYSAVGMLYLANESDLIISNNANGTTNQYGTNITVYYQNPNRPANYIQPVPRDLMVFSNATTQIYAYSFVTNATFYDYRESKTVNALQINVAALNSWMTNNNAAITNGGGGLQFDNLNDSGSTTKGHHIWSIYAYNSAPFTGSQLPGVRIVKGTMLPPSGLTVSTPEPLYVEGSYNIQTNYNATTSQMSRGVPDATYTQPSALMCDAITVLSTNYQDIGTYKSGTSLSSRTAIADVFPSNNTNLVTVNAAILTGIVPSTNGFYSGGVENIIRLLENWPSSDSVENTGSQVAMFASLYATNHWQAPGVYYNAPGLNSGFDQNFETFNLLPPLTPRFSATIRAGWALY